MNKRQKEFLIKLADLMDEYNVEIDTQPDEDFHFYMCDVDFCKLVSLNAHYLLAHIESDPASDPDDIYADRPFSWDYFSKIHIGSIFSFGDPPYYRKTGDSSYTEACGNRKSEKIFDEKSAGVLLKVLKKNY